MKRVLTVIAFVTTAGAASVIAQQPNFDSVVVRTQPAGRGVHLLTGSGGNIALAVGEDFAFLVDDQFAPLTTKILAAVRGVTDKPVRFLVNTHWHGDHAGGNENMAKAGVILVAHDNVRTRMSTEQFTELFNRRSPPSPRGALPVVTFGESVTFHLGGETVHVVHVPPAHTDGDAIVHFVRANTIHMGDNYFKDVYPFVDLSSGGSFEGVIRAADVALGYANDSTVIIPGHGALANRADLKKYRDVLVQVRERVAALIRQGKTREEVIAARPTAEWDATWGAGFMKPDVFLGIVYQSMTKQ
ncbi:MAG TPA: MBL fold metallo-hydrolase [Gemmatimonadales bacterium]|nr:MBL fold metallo-hydrolase [Gemmatimonadales bacterium]